MQAPVIARKSFVMASPLHGAVKQPPTLAILHQPFGLPSLSCPPSSLHLSCQIITTALPPVTLLCCH